MARQALTDRFIKSRKAAAPGTRNDYPDSVVPGLALRVTDRGHKSFVLVARYPSNPKHPTRRSLGATNLGKAREKARRWIELIGQGIDPKIDEERQRAIQQRQQVTTWSAVVADFLEQHAKGLAKENEARRVLDKELGRRWGARPVTEVTRLDISTAIRAIVARGAPAQARNSLGWVASFYSWAIGTGLYGIEASPTSGIKPSKLIGAKISRDRVLSDDELRVVWQASDRLGYPYGQLIRLLILTGQRRDEVARMSWTEVDFSTSLWTVPAERMKGDRAHEVPLSADAVSLLKALPRPAKKDRNGEYLFSTTDGAKPVNGFSKAKVRIDREIAKIHAEAHGGEDNKLTEQDALPEWVFHDLRRTMRTHLSALPVQDIVRELVIAHAKPGLHKVYDQHAYLDEKRRCFELWEARLRTIIASAKADVADLANEKVLRARRTIQGESVV
jgi:integrase